MRRDAGTSMHAAPVVRLRFMAMGLLVLASAIAGPLLLVWKQAYIAGSSLRLEAMTDTLSVLNREIATLRFERARLSTNERIEKTARTLLQLDYPSADRIVPLPLEERRAKRGLAAEVAQVFAAVQEKNMKGGRE